MLWRTCSELDILLSEPSSVRWSSSHRRRTISTSLIFAKKYNWLLQHCYKYIGHLIQQRHVLRNMSRLVRTCAGSRVAAHIAVCAVQLEQVTRYVPWMYRLVRTGDAIRAATRDPIRVVQLGSKSQCYPFVVQWWKCLTRCCLACFCKVRPGLLLKKLCS